VLAYGVVLLCAAIAYYIVVRTLLRSHGEESVIARAYGCDIKGKVSLAIYIASVLVAWFVPWLAFAGYVLVAFIWIVPDRRFARRCDY
jgi:TMEM175 potassium channel family protein